MEAARFLDLYAGSGAVGIEALSRGAASVVFAERAQPALRALKANLDRLGIRAGVKVHAGSVASYLKRAGDERFDVVFLDPPYDLEQEYETALRLVAELVAEDGVVIAEHRRKDKLQDAYGALKRTRLLEQGDASLSFYALEQEIASPLK